MNTFPALQVGVLSRVGYHDLRTTRNSLRQPSCGGQGGEYFTMQRNYNLPPGVTLDDLDRPFHCPECGAQVERRGLCAECKED